MKYDPIMCMMVDDSVKTEDANKNEGFKIHKAEVRGDKLYLTYTDLLYGGKETESFTKNEAKGFLTDPWNTWEGNTKSVMMKFVKDSNTIDHAIRSCDISMYERIYQEAKAAVGGKYGIISNLSDLETAINDANRRGEKEDAKKLKAIYKKYN